MATKKQSIKKYIRKQKKRSAKRSVNRSAKRSVKRSPHQKTKRSIKHSVYKMRGMGTLLHMYGGATAEVEAQYEQLKKQKEELEASLKTVLSQKQREDYEQRLAKIKAGMQAAKEKTAALFKSIGSAISQASMKTKSSIQSGISKLQEKADIQAIQAAERAQQRQEEREKQRTQSGSGFHRKKESKKKEPTTLLSLNPSFVKQHSKSEMISPQKQESKQKQKK